MNARIDTTGLEKYLLQLARAGESVDEFAAAAVDEGATIIEQELLARVPVDEGELKKQIYRTPLRRDGNKFFAYAGLDLGDDKKYLYGLVLEFGSKRTPARPWFRPGVSAAKRKNLTRWNRMFKQRYG